MPFASSKLTSNHRDYYRYYRFRITATQGLALAVTIGKIQLFDLGRETTNILSAGSAVWASSLNMGIVASNIVNMAQQTLVWTSAGLAGMPQWVEVDAGASIALERFIITSSPNALQLGDAPATFTLQGSNDRVSYVDLKSFTANWTSVGSKTFTM